MIRNTLIIFFIFFSFLFININSNSLSLILKDTENISNLLNYYGDGADLDVEGSLIWNNIRPGKTVTGSFIVKNIGTSNSELSWKISERPDWGTWTFNPNRGDGLKPEDDPIKVQVTLVAPDESNKDFSGRIQIINLHNQTRDTEILWVTLSTSYARDLNGLNNRLLINNFENILKSFSLENFENIIKLINLIKNQYSN